MSPSSDTMPNHVLHCGHTHNIIRMGKSSKGAKKKAAKPQEKGEKTPRTV